MKFSIVDGSFLLELHLLSFVIIEISTNMLGITRFKKHESLTEGHLIPFCGLFNHFMVWTLQLVEHYRVRLSSSFGPDKTLLPNIL